MEKARILIVEDEELVAMSIQDTLQELGHLGSQIETSGEAALAAIPKFAPDLILMDIHLDGEMSGTEAACIIRESFMIPVVFLTAFSDDKTVQDAKRAAPYGYLVKPFDEKTLQSTIEIALFKASLESELKRDKEHTESILHSVGEAIIVAGPTGLVDFMNAKAEALFGGLTARETVSIVSLFSLRSAGDGSPLRLDIASVLFGGNSLTLSNIVVSRTSRPDFTADLDLVPLRDESGTARGLILTVREGPGARHL